MLEESGLEYDEGYLGVDGDVFDPFRVRAIKQYTLWTSRKAARPRLLTYILSG